jgi:phosphomannomutase
LGVETIFPLHCNPDGNFPHNPEPLPEHLNELANLVPAKSADLGIAVDPDVDRLALVSEDGSLFGEEYTLVAVADYVLQQRKGNTVSNLSSTRALRDVTYQHGGQYFAAAVGEVNVVQKMKSVNAVIGGEGNGGIIHPALHYGRDALAGIALFLSHLALSGKRASALRAQYPAYFMTKNKLQLPAGFEVKSLFESLKQQFRNADVNEEDGLKLDFENHWFHLRSSNTEPIVRLYVEAKTMHQQTRSPAS